MSVCAACIKRGQTWSGDAPQCAFRDRAFSRDNWNCATVGLIRDLAYEGQFPMPPGVDYRYCEDMKYVTVCIHGMDGCDGAMALWIAWYKSRGGTDAMWLLFDDQPPRQPTEEECLQIVSYFAERAALRPDPKESS